MTKTDKVGWNRFDMDDPATWPEEGWYRIVVREEVIVGYFHCRITLGEESDDDIGWKDGNMNHIPNIVRYWGRLKNAISGDTFAVRRKGCNDDNR